MKTLEMRCLAVANLASASLVIASLAGLAACAAVPAGRSADAGPQRLVSEDDQVRIEELRLRGQTQRVTVAPKGGAGRPYEILLPAPGADAAQHRDAAGQRVWPVLTF